MSGHSDLIERLREWGGDEKDERGNYRAYDLLTEAADELEAAQGERDYLAKQICWEPGHIEDERTGEEVRPVDWALILIAKYGKRMEELEAAPEQGGVTDQAVEAVAEAIKTRCCSFSDGDGSAGEGWADQEYRRVAREILDTRPHLATSGVPEEEADRLREAADEIELIVDPDDVPRPEHRDWLLDHAAALRSMADRSQPQEEEQGPRCGGGGERSTEEGWPADFAARRLREVEDATRLRAQGADGQAQKQLWADVDVLARVARILEGRETAERERDAEAHLSARGVQLAERQNKRIRRLEDALRVIRGPEDHGPWMAVYREAGGGYAGLQAIAEAALGDDDG